MSFISVFFLCEIETYDSQSSSKIHYCMSSYHIIILKGLHKYWNFDLFLFEFIDTYNMINAYE